MRHAEVGESYTDTIETDMHLLTEALARTSFASGCHHLPNLHGGETFAQ